MRVHMSHREAQADTSLNLLCPVLLLRAYTMGESPTKQLTVTIPTNIAMVYYQHPEIADSS